MRIFLSYRREDASGHAGRLYDVLAARFGERNVFMDVDTIDPGADFGEAITRAVSSCDALIALVGREWLSPRLEEPDDFVRLELEAALERGVPVIPALVQGARPPAAEQLPASLAPLARRQGAELRDVGWRDDVNRLISRLEREQSPEPEGPHRRRRWLVLGVVALAVVAAAAAGLLLTRDSDDDGGGDGGGSDFPNAIESTLLAAIPRVSRVDCGRGEEYAAADASVSCSGTKMFVQYYVFERERDVDAWYLQRRETVNVAPDTGSCTVNTFRGEVPLSPEGGRRLCYLDGDEPYVVWTDPRMRVGASANIWNPGGKEQIASLLRQWPNFRLEPSD